MRGFLSKHDIAKILGDLFTLPLYQKVRPSVLSSDASFLEYTENQTFWQDAIAKESSGNKGSEVGENVVDCEAWMKEKKTSSRDLVCWPRNGSERTRRLLAASEAMTIGRGGIALVSRATGLSRKAISAGIKQRA